MRVRQGDPELYTVEQAGVGRGCFFGMRDAAAGRHEAQVARADEAFVIEAVVVDHFTGEEPRERLEPNMRVGRDIHRLAFGKG